MSPSERAARQLSTTCLGYARCARSYRYNENFTPAAGSPLAQELETEHDLAGAWGDDPIRQVLSIASTQLFVADDHLNAIGAVLVADEPAPLSLATLARVVTESSARAWWLLDADIAARERVARGMTERLFGLLQSRKDLLEVQKDNSISVESELRDAEARIERVRSCARELGFSVNTSKRDVWASSINAPRPNATELCASIFKGRWGSVLYRSTAGVAHATGTSVFRFLDPMEDPHGDHELLMGHGRESQFATILVRSSLLAYGTAFDFQVEGHGWDPDLWRSWRASRLRPTGP